MRTCAACRTGEHEARYHLRLLRYRWRTAHSRQAKMRAVLWFMTGYYIEDCQQCGRKMPLSWWAPDDLWLQLVGSPAGIYCPVCFDALAESSGYRLRWSPRTQHEEAS